MKRWPGEGIETRLAELFRQTAQAHHQAFIETDGADPEWPAWYAAYLSAPLQELLGVRPTQTELADLLVRIESQRAAEGEGGDWPQYYAAWIIKTYL